VCDETERGGNVRLDQSLIGEGRRALPPQPSQDGTLLWHLADLEGDFLALSYPEQLPD
jgi:hypothetical protein